MSGNFLSCSKGVKDPFDVQEGSCEFPLDAEAEKGLISPGGENLLDFLELWQVPLELRRGPLRPTGVTSGKCSFHATCKRPLRISLPSMPGPKILCRIGAVT